MLPVSVCSGSCGCRQALRETALFRTLDLPVRDASSVACDPANQQAPRCRLRRLYTQPGVSVTGYGADDRVEVVPETHFVIGRTTDAEIHISAQIGGHRTFSVFWRPPSWIFKINNEWAIALVDGDRLRSTDFPSIALHDGSVIEIRDVHSDEPVHRFRVEIG
jgi:hypothetical protein